MIQLANSAGVGSKEDKLRRVAIAKARWREKRDAYRAANDGKYPTAKEAKEISNRIVEEFTVDRGFWGTDTNFIRAEIPILELEEIIATVKANTKREITLRDAEDRWLEIHNSRPAEQ